MQAVLLNSGYSIAKIQQTTIVLSSCDMLFNIKTLLNSGYSAGIELLHSGI